MPSYANSVVPTATAPTPKLRSSTCEQRHQARQWVWCPQLPTPTPQFCGQLLEQHVVGCRLQIERHELRRHSSAHRRRTNANALHRPEKHEHCDQIECSSPPCPRHTSASATSLGESWPGFRVGRWMTASGALPTCARRSFASEAGRRERHGSCAMRKVVENGLTPETHRANGLPSPSKHD